MQIVIDIDESLLDGIKSDDFDFARQVVKNFQGTIASAIANGTPIPDNATFGDMFEKVFRPFKVVKKGMCVDVYRTKSRFENNIIWFTFSIREWNALYQKGGKE